MARAPTQIAQGIANPSDNTGKLVKAGLYKLDNNNQVNTSIGHFLLNPNSYNETKASNWHAHSVPGQSDPIYQWVNGGPRQVTFESLVTQDSSNLDNPRGAGESLVERGVSVVGSIASTFAGVSIPPVADLFPSGASAGTRLSIAQELMYYRSLLYPEYAEGYSGLVSSPPLVVLLSGRTFSNVGVSSSYAPAGNPSGSYLPVWVVTNISIRITKQLPNLDPMEATVSFTLNEYPIKPVSIGNMVIGDPGTGPAEGNSPLAAAGKLLNKLF